MDDEKRLGAMVHAMGERERSDLLTVARALLAGRGDEVDELIGLDPAGAEWRRIIERLQEEGDDGIIERM